MPESWTHAAITTNGIKLHYVTQGEGPLILMLHGFPEFWYSWRHQIPVLATDHKVVALDLRGYNDSEKPAAQSAYVMAEFIKDIQGVIQGLGYDRCTLIGHDWGGAIAWFVADAHPELVDRLIVLNFPHPAKFAEGLRLPQQLWRSSYIAFFQLPVLPEIAIQANDYWVLEQAFRGMAVNPQAFTDADIETYKNALARPGALTAALNYYRNAFQHGILKHSWGVLPVPTLMLWGEKDLALSKELTDGTERYVRDFRIRYLADCSHWLQSEQPQVVNQYIRAFLVP